MEEKNKGKIETIYNLSVYWSFLKNYKWAFIFLIVVVLIGELKQLVDKYLFKVIIDNGTEFAAGTLLEAQFISILMIVAGVFILGMLVNSLVNWLRIHLVNKIDAGIIYDLKERFFNHILGLDYKFHTTHKTGSLISRLTRGGGAIERITDSIAFEFAPLILQLIVVTAALIYFDFVSAIVILGTFVVFLAFSLYMQRRITDSNVVLNQAEDFEKGNIADFFTNIDSIRSFGKEKFIKSRYRKLSTDTKLKALKSWDYWRIVSVGQSFILSLGTFLLIYFSVLSLLNNQITLGTLTFIYTTYLGLIGPLFSFVNGVRNVSRAMADFQDLFEYGKFQNEIKDKANALEFNVKKGEIEFDNVSFSYGKRQMFEDFNLKISENKKIALVGHSGCGKTSLVRLLYRLYDIDSGSIKIDGINIKDFKQESLRSGMSVVPQECVLFDDTIYNNVKFSKPNATKKEVMKAIKFAQLDKIILNFPKKEQTIVGERGVKLSGGEKQRVSIARAILSDKKILVLDEATSSLDSQTESEIQRDLESLMQGRTAIIIAHRLSTIMKADKIVVLEKGKIVQQGTHRQLINQQGLYRRLWDLQKGGYIK